MRSSLPRRRPAARARQRPLGALLALLAVPGLTGCSIQGAALGQGASASGPTSAVVVSVSVPAGAPPAASGQPSGAAGSPVALPASPATSFAPVSTASTEAGTTNAAAPATITEMFGLPDLTPLLDALLDPMPDPKVLGPQLDEALEVESGTMSAAVIDTLSGEVLYDRSAEEPVAPASAVKIFTGIAALEVLGPEHRYTTSAVALPGHLGTGAVTHVVLDAGGDVLLGTGDNGESTDGHAGLGTLARQAVEALAQQQVTGAVAVRVDDTGYNGPTESDHWSSDIVSSGNVSVVQPIATHGGRPAADGGTNRLHDPARYAAEAFRDRLAEHAQELDVDIQVSDDVDRLALEGRGSTLASVQSATVAEQVAHMLKASDNQVAEATGRNLALAAGQPGSFDGATRTIEDTLADLGVDTNGLDLVDASGLAGANRASALQLAASLRVAATDPVLAVAVAGLPAAGQEGTLEHRMVGSAAEDSVRAKTGTLSSVTSLSGTVETADDRRLMFSFIANGQPGVLTDARRAVDSGAVVLAGCGCREKPAD